MRHVAVLVLLAGVASIADAREFRSIRFNHLSQEDGLAQGSVNCMLQDHAGFMWFGTQDGLNRYDGYSFETFKNDPTDPSTLSHNFVWAVHMDRQGTIWVGTEGGGLDRWDRETDTFEHFRNDPDDPRSLSNDRVRSILEDRNGVLWVGTEDGLNRFDRQTGEFERFQHDPDEVASLSSGLVRDVHEDRDGALWIGTDGGGLNRLDPASGEFSHYRHDDADPTSLGSDRVRSIYEDDQGRLWIGTYDAGLSRLDPNSGKFDRLQHDPEDPSSLSHNMVRAMYEDHQGRLWVATDGGLNLWEKGTRRFDRFQNDPARPTSLANNRVMSMFQDRGEVLWFGTLGGLSRWNPTLAVFTHYEQEASADSTLSSNTITAFAQSPDGVLWVGTFGGGLNRLERDSGSIRHFRHDAADARSLSDDRVMSVLMDRQGDLWVGTIVGGLNRLDRATNEFTTYRHDPDDAHSLSANGITAIFEDSRGSLWVGTYRGGLNRFDRDSGKAERFRHDPSDPASLGDDRVMTIYEGTRGMLWIGTEGGGLNRLDPHSGRFTRIRNDPTDPSSLSSNVILALHETADGTMWIGTQGAGLNRWSAEDRSAGRHVFQVFREKDGLPNELIYAILEDDDEHLWLSTNMGLSRFDPETGVFKNYDATRGLQGNEFNFGAHLRGIDGEMFFGGNNGFNSFHPREVLDNGHAPPVVLTKILKLNRKADLDRPPEELEQIEFGYKDYVVSFEFAALDFTTPGKNRYAYMLEGFDRDWIELGTMRRATYTNLSPGSYVFRVRGSNGDGLWNDAGVALKVKVVPPPWKTWWAYSLYGIALVGMVLRYTRAQAMKLQREEEYSRKLELEVKQRTVELADRNSELETANSKLEEASLTDSLTGLRNRRYMMTYLDQDIALIHREYKNRKDSAEERAAAAPDVLFMMVDLDGFKQVNDVHGHAAGDRVLVAVREVMQSSARESDTIIRWGGDEFLIVYRNVKGDGAEILAERLRRSISECRVTLDDGQTVGVGCSIGFSFYPFFPSQPALVEWEKVLAVADRALYIAKESGRNAWVGIVSACELGSEEMLRDVIDRPEQLREQGSIKILSSLSEGLVRRRA